MADVGDRLVVDPPTVAGPSGRQPMARWTGRRRFNTTLRSSYVSAPLGTFGRRMGRLGIGGRRVPLSGMEGGDADHK